MSERRARRYIVEIQENQGDTRDPTTNELIDAWATVATRRASIVPRGKLVKGGEAEVGGQASGTIAQTLVMTCFVDEDGNLMSPRYRLKLHGRERYFEIINVANPGEERGTSDMNVYCVEKV